MKGFSGEMKRRARAALEGYYLPAVSLTVSLTLFTAVLALLSQAGGLYAAPGLLNRSLYWILYLITLLLGALFEIGPDRFLLSLCRKKPLREQGLLFYGFRNQPDTYILAYGFRYLVSLVWFVPSLYVYEQLPLVIDLTEPLPAGLTATLGTALLLALAGLIPAIWLALPWSLTTFVLLDRPDCSAAEALRTSHRLTKGCRGRILLLWLSFLPLCLLGLGSLGIGFFWIRPYFHTAMGEVYLELAGEQAADEESTAQTVGA